ncbi:TIGR01777 family oxidoreductase [Paenisporosarcina quisquiliarum]|uniref:TIGR01777 family oxidoreductase n=1 Tax=Paenisporosarcina quisquiliarum TaxID=365346 RepID=A0A9X3RCY7_9BACL|nr:TIGR01777 family oxidoreductase [Paenisporosarcina quisquiliarum]MCZ8536986.1 TIGR01777 family oxidoreductase [Paenisporosarcina quisquiliarum]
MKVAITGGSGFVGQEITKQLTDKGHEVYILTRSDKKSDGSVHMIKWLADGAKPEEHLDGMDAWINLAGASINEGRWTPEQKQKIYDSRMKATDEVLRILKAVSTKPSVLVNASAIGIYPPSEQATYTEHSSARGSDFLAKTVEDWESKANEAEQLGTRVAAGRFGIVLGKDQGALPLMALPYKMGVGGKVGTGEQWVSWVHVADVAKAILYVIENEDFTGPFNLTAPDPKQMNDFGEILGKVLHRPHWIPVPSIALKLALGDKSQLVLEGQRVIPDKLLTHGFKFTHPDLQRALENIYA